MLARQRRLITEARGNRDDIVRLVRELEHLLPEASRKLTTLWEAVLDLGEDEPRWFADHEDFDKVTLELERAWGLEGIGKMRKTLGMLKQMLHDRPFRR